MQAGVVSLVICNPTIIFCPCRQIVDLQAELAMHDAMSGRSGVSYAPYSEEQRAMLKDQVWTLQDLLVCSLIASCNTSMHPDACADTHHITHITNITLLC
jgi:hypothetical protein